MIIISDGQSCHFYNHYIYISVFLYIFVGNWVYIYKLRKQNTQSLTKLYIVMWSFTTMGNYVFCHLRVGFCSNAKVNKRLVVSSSFFLFLFTILKALVKCCRQFFILDGLIQYFIRIGLNQELHQLFFFALCRNSSPFIQSPIYFLCINT